MVCWCVTTVPTKVENLEKKVTFYNQTILTENNSAVRKMMVAASSGWWRAALMMALALLAAKEARGQEAGAEVKRPEQFAENLLKCAQKQNVPFDICLRMIMEDLRSQMTVGFPEFGLGPTEPLSIRNLQFKSKPQFSGAVKVDANFTNVRPIIGSP